MRAGRPAFTRSGIRSSCAARCCRSSAGSQRKGIKKTLLAELMLHPDDSPLRLNGCGMVIVNPPWQFDRWLKELLPELVRLLARDAHATQRVEWLTAE